MQKFLICLIMMIFMAGCQPASLDDDVNPALASTPLISPTDQVKIATPISTQVTLSQPALESPATSTVQDPRESDQMPIFLEVTQTTIMGENPAQSPAVGVGPIIYFYSPADKTLSLSQTVTVGPETELLIGMVTILQTPGQDFEKREIFQFPSVQPASIQVSALDPETGTLKLLFAGEAFDLPPGESRTFKQVDGESNAPTVITIVANHGHLAGIQPVSPDGSWR